MIEPADADDRAAELLDATQKTLGIVPNMAKAMASAPAVLEGYLGLSGALGGGVLSPRLREQIALLSAETNGCRYCLAAHSAIGKSVGLSANEIAEIIGAVVVNVFTNYFNRAALPVIDFLEVEPARAC